MGITIGSSHKPVFYHKISGLLQTVSIVELIADGRYIFLELKKGKIQMGY